MNKLNRIFTGWQNYYKDKKGRLPPEIKELFDNRLRICRSNVCQAMFMGICTACGCPIKKKTKVLEETCPENMWNPAIYDYDGISFIKLEEIPNQLRKQFELWSAGRQKPDIPGVDAINCEDWDRFLQYIQGNPTD